VAERLERTVVEVIKHLLERATNKDKAPYFIEGGRRENGLAGLLRDMGVKVGAEIGTEHGLYAKCLLKTIPGLKLYCIDAWESYGDYRARAKDRQITFYEEAKQRLSPYNCELIRAYSMDAVKVFEDESLDFVFIDANHDFAHATEDIAHWSKKVKKGGIVSGHDYFRKHVPDEQIHVKDVVNGWTYSYGINPWFVFTGDKGPSWAWVKQ
jgi:predicted O-methyltransferase YrrM